MNDWLTLQEACALTRISRSGLMRAIGDGRLKATKPARKIFIHRDELTKFFEGGVIKPKTA